MKRILVVGGGAGGLELITKLGNKLGKNPEFKLTLVDSKPNHIWKPLLHEVATGSLDANIDSISFRDHAKKHHFHFQIGKLQNIDRQAKKITLAAMYDEHNELLLPKRQLEYDILVLAIGSVCNDFNTPGAKEHCIFLNDVEQAEYFRKEMTNQFLKLHNNQQMKTLDIAIVGAGATGVELAAELFHSINTFQYYDLKDLDNSRLNVNLIEAGESILPALPQRISNAVYTELTKLGVHIHTNTKVTAIDQTGLTTHTGTHIPAKLIVWAAGVKAPDFIKNIPGLETNKINQLLVKPTLQTTQDDDIYVIGDLAACPQPNGKFVPPRAQAAHQMASCCYQNILAKLKNKPQKDYLYKDYGSLISLSNYSTIGNLMGNLVKGSMMIEGHLARIMYISLYRMHQIALHGIFKTGLIMLSGQINRIIRPKLKLH
ncbi:FAD-dependent oxidoreductase [Mergibacter septicus]|uniref:NAD(P)/FAD-dependent oxidoreductase n=1 Tax=Mergibacter septicus TaxID=221402 RepID=UPI00117965EF|nr:NAD(P)/FAD-dependent oxidoreductase [Mergibacter septicus]AWX14317.1 FAD-dependent oxidoreductase [Mergibacter septicus]